MGESEPEGRGWLLVLAAGVVAAAMITALFVAAIVTDPSPQAIEQAAAQTETGSTGGPLFSPAGVAAVGLAVAGLNVWLYHQGESG